MGSYNWAAGQRPREGLLAHGRLVLSDPRLLALLLRRGTEGRGALAVARDLLGHFGGLPPSFVAPVKQVAQARGLGPAKAAELAAVVELVRRSLAEEATAADALTSPQAVRDYLRLTLRARPYEVFVGIFLDSQNRLLAF